MIARRPDAVTLPQFWAEDGAIFYQPALDGRGADVLFEPWAGYFHLFPRLVAWATSGVPPECTPAVFNGAALLIASASVWLFTLPLARPLIASDSLRLALALLFILSNPAVETFGNATNAQWWMCVGVLVLIAVPIGGPTTLAQSVSEARRPPRLRFGLVWACGFVALTALSSPLPVLFVPIALVMMIAGGRPYRAAGLALVSGVIVQLLGRYFLTGREPALPEEQSFIQILRLTGDSCHATLLHLFPGYAMAAELHEALPWAGWLLAGLLFACLVIGALWPGSWRSVSLVLSAVYLLIAALAVVAVTRGCCPSSFLLNGDMPVGGRYVFLPYTMCVFLLGLALQPRLGAAAFWPRIAALVLLAIVAVCSIAGAPPMILLEDLHWSEHVRAARERGTETIPINPDTSEWKVELRMPWK